jgi:hypothetical protein
MLALLALAAHVIFAALPLSARPAIIRGAPNMELPSPLAVSREMARIRRSHAIEAPSARRVLSNARHVEMAGRKRKSRIRSKRRWRKKARLRHLRKKRSWRKRRWKRRHRSRRRVRRHRRHRRRHHRRHRRRRICWVRCLPRREPIPPGYDREIAREIKEHNSQGREHGQLKLYVGEKMWGPQIMLQSCYGDNIVTKFSIDPAGNELPPGARLWFQYRLRGKRKKWVMVEPGEVIRGRYVFLRAQASEGSGIIVLATRGSCINP